MIGDSLALNLPPIPIVDKLVDAGSYKSVPVNTEDARYQERLVRIRDAGISGVPYYHISDGRNPPYNKQIEGSLPDLWCREGVLEKLKQANSLLSSHNCSLFVWNAYRPITVQKGLWHFWEQDVLKRNPKLAKSEIYNEVIKYVSDPNLFDRSDSRTWPTHTTGAAVDLTLCSLRDGALLDMGADFDEMDETSHSDHFERQLKNGACDVTSPALINRRLLHWAMETAGFVNYPLEYWHFDWGNQMYVFNSKAVKGRNISAAWYGFVDL